MRNQNNDGRNQPHRTAATVRVRYRCAVIAGVLISATSAQVVKQQGFLPFADAPIEYRTSKNLDDPIARLQKRMDRGEVQLNHEPQHGYLRSVLKELRVPVSSQALVFSKTSFQFPLIQPSSPRALYFNDDVYVGQVHHSKSLEFVSFDANQGAIFYILSEAKAEHPRFERSQIDCIQCHVSTAMTRGVPGVMVRSVATSPTGYQTAGTPASVTGHESLLQQRWAGWYVTGELGALLHLGNRITATAQDAAAAPDPAQQNRRTLDGWIDTSRYLTNTSDVVAHLVLAHQTQMHNLITELNYRTRLAADADQKNTRSAGRSGALSTSTPERLQNTVEALVRYLFFIDEAPLEQPLRGTSGYAEEFASLGPRDGKGRSLRDFDLQRRIFKYPCSYLIYSEDFDAIPSPAKELVHQRIFEVLSGRDHSEPYQRLSAQDRRAMLEILIATKPGWEARWQSFLQQRSGTTAGDSLPSGTGSGVQAAAYRRTAHHSFEQKGN